jgi:hypothetical protein
MPQHFRTQRDVKPATRGEAVAIAGQLAAKGTTEVGPHSECRHVLLSCILMKMLNFTVLSPERCTSPTRA